MFVALSPVRGVHEYVYGGMPAEGMHDPRGNAREVAAPRRRRVSDFRAESLLHDKAVHLMALDRDEAGDHEQVVAVVPECLQRERQTNHDRPDDNGSSMLAGHGHLHSMRCRT